MNIFALLPACDWMWIEGHPRWNEYWFNFDEASFFTGWGSATVVCLIVYFLIPKP